MPQGSGTDIMESTPYSNNNNKIMKNKIDDTSDETPKTEPDRLKQGLLLLFLVIPQLLVWRYGGDHGILSRWYYLTLAAIFHEQIYQSPFLWFCIFLLSIERIVYSFVWLYPKKFTKLCDAPWFRSICKVSGTITNQSAAEATKPIKIVEKFFYFNKLAQFGSYTLYFFAYSGAEQFLDYLLDHKITYWQYVTFFQTLCLGLLLNFSIYKAIGKVGVYYGVKLGYQVPWCHDFPFNVIGAHPQYLGSMLNVIAVLILLASDENLVQNGWFLLGIAQCVFYAYMAVVEQYF